MAYTAGQLLFKSPFPTYQCVAILREVGGRFAAASSAVRVVSGLQTANGTTLFSVWVWVRTLRVCLASFVASKATLSVCWVVRL